MRYGIFADIHSNLEAFQAVIDAYKKEAIDRYILAGDIVGYGADPHWCIEEIKRLNIKAVCGNHDWASAGVFRPDYFNDAAKKAVEWTEERLSQEEKAFLKNLDLVIKEADFSVVHGSLKKPDLFYYIMDTDSAYACFREMREGLCFVGHSHAPLVFFTEGDKIKKTFDRPINIRSGKRYIVNVGSVGQPRDGDPRASFCIYDTDKKTIEIKRVAYDIESAKKKILSAGLPGVLAYRLVEGH
jgi:diadenosine tetraphosphatase ApaH/serine/threonine PP2A family protein phosphatase